ncbi:hypothetical protein [Rhodococcus tibetensis]|uniref:Uncharacterized protein n=1 Tax=Rhodococcus tibetensis TaxID=2965064 RepID=A0ABT1QGK0_9NOCA|nr:hypothetical protein [Rhodococcus sp. FXJ9.536]MCQ4120235.1 hypothetical protein [Rhodococcus sp. FXJ9.536]
MTTEPTALMDDPTLSRDYKEQLLHAWASSRGEDEALWGPYFDAYGIDKRERTPSADERYTALLADGIDARSAAAGRLQLEDLLGSDSLNAPGVMLDLGARGLGFFELFLPAARKLGYDSRDITDYYARFDAERGMDLHVLGRDVETLHRALTSARRELEEHEACVAAVSAAWSGVAATTAIDAAGRQNARADADVDRLRGLVEVLFEANLTLSAAVTNKAYRVVSLHQSTVAGYSAAQISVLADIAVHGRDGDNSVAKDCMEDASYWYPDLADDDYRHINGLYKDGGGGALRWLDRDDVVKRAAGIARAWLDANFRPVYEEKQHEFAAACEDCANAVEASYTAVIAEARTPPVVAEPVVVETPVPPVPPPALADTAPIGSGSGVRDVGIRGVPTEPAASLPVAAPATPGAAAIPGFTVSPGGAGLPGPSGIPGLAQVPGLGAITGLGDLSGTVQGLAGGLGDLGSLIRPLIEDAVSALTRRDDDGHNEMDEEPDPEKAQSAADDSGSGPSVPLAHDKSLELKLDGKSWTLVVDEDGSGVHLAIIDGQGGTSRFGVEIGPNGLPQIFAETGPGENPRHEAASECEPAPVTEIPPGGADAAPSARSGAAEHHEAEAPTPASDESTTTSGPQPVAVQDEPLPESQTVSEPTPAPEPEPASEPEPAPVSGPPATLDSGAELAEAGPL